MVEMNLAHSYIGGMFFLSFDWFTLSNHSKFIIPFLEDIF